MKKVIMTVEALNAQLATSEQEVTVISEQLKAAKKAKKAYEKLIEALKEQKKATSKVVRVTKKAIAAVQESEEVVEKSITTSKKEAPELEVKEQPVTSVKEEPVFFFIPKEEEEQIFKVMDETARDVAMMENDEFITEYKQKPVRIGWLEKRQRRRKNIATIVTKTKK